MFNVVLVVMGKWCFGCNIKCPAKQGVKYPLDGVSK